MTSEQNYPGYEELTSYLTRSRDKSFWGFLHRCRDTIVTTASATSRRQDLDDNWATNFIREARKRGEDLNNKVSEDRKRYDFEDYWNDVINECKIRRDISERKVEKERILHDLSKINDEIKMKEDELTRILNKQKIHPKDSSNLDEDLIVQSSSAIEKDLIAMQSSSAIDENSTAMQSSSAIDYANNAPKLPRQRNPRNKERINYNIESLSKKSVSINSINNKRNDSYINKFYFIYRLYHYHPLQVFGKAEKEKESAQEVVLYIGFAQATVQMESSLTCRKRKANEINDECGLDKVWGIVTDAEKWYFMECTLDKGRPSFKLSEPITVVYKDKNMQMKVERVLSHIIWLLKEAQKPVEASPNGEQSRVLKKQKSSCNLIDTSNQFSLVR
ncbi:14585_t:CDS:2 [Cetraspora pellucida]|uniref:14585_t:CDS:1 n=1 Tax=Cetraspora pellucida TaxID=1433469 RepID=A0ACA9KD26_9GLOM|nr:14585_t:CDS:2 [Cetraspora pellucida]